MGREPATRTRFDHFLRELGRTYRGAGRLDVFTFDPISTVLAKIERGSNQDINDVLTLVRRNIVDLPTLSAALEEILPRRERESLRIDETDFRRKFEAFLTLAQEQQQPGA